MHQSSMTISLVSFAADRADRAADHAIRVEARSARAGDQELVEPQALADQAGHAVVGVGAGLGAFVAAGAFLQVEHEQVLGVHQALIEEVVERRFRLASTASRRLVFEALRRLGDHVRTDRRGLRRGPRGSRRRSDPHQVDVVKGRAGGGADAGARPRSRISGRSERRPISPK